MLPAIDAEAHKGTRGKVLIEGGSTGMTGAAILAARAALRAGAGMVKVRSEPKSLEIVTLAIPEALTEDSAGGRSNWADVAVIGPGFGRDDAAIDRVAAAIRSAPGPVVLDADALNAFEGRRERFRDALAGRSAVLTPHVVEAARLAGVSPAAVEDQRFDIGLRLARDLGAVVLLKGVPTIVTAPDGRIFVIPSGTPSLATGGSGDVLSGIAGTLLCQIKDVAVAAACAAWIHGRAAELTGPFIRGTTLDDVLELLPNALRVPDEQPRYPVIAELPAIPNQ
jgi:NAD(P)H-hydrate epimerase